MKLVYIVSAAALFFCLECFVLQSANIKQSVAYQLIHNNETAWNIMESFTCFACKLTVAEIQQFIYGRKTEAAVCDAIINICISLKIEKEDICRDIVPEYKDEFFYVVSNLALNPDEACGMFLGESCSKIYNPLDNWTLVFPALPKPPVTPPKYPKASAPKLRILHISDVHVDFHYKPGGNANCGYPLCCRDSDGTPIGTPAGYWGDYRSCDTPMWTLENMLQHITSKEKFDLVYWTGDLPGHNIWEQSREDQIYAIQKISALLRQYMQNTTVLPSLGNHESSPVDSFPPSFVTGHNNISWLYTTLAQEWKNWLPSEQMQNILKGAFYTVLIKPGFRIISLNSNYCNTNNFWLYLNTKDPENQLAWLINILQQAEINKEKVHILGHIPPGHQACLKSWSYNFYKIVNRYESTIAGQFYGHTHFDQVEVFYDLETLQRPLNVAYIGPSVTPFKNLNPGYRIYVVDGLYKNSSFAVIDHETYIMNLKEANEAGKSIPPSYKLEYSAKLYYEMASLFPEDWDKLIERMGTDDAKMQAVYSNMYKGHPPNPRFTEDDRNIIRCKMRSASTMDMGFCKNISLEISHKTRKWEKTHTLC